MSSKIKTISENPQNNVDIIKILSLFCGEKKSKYIELLNKSLTSYIKGNNLFNCKQYLARKLGLSMEELDNLTEWEICLLYRFDSNRENSILDLLVDFKKFCELNERGLIIQNDISKYSDFKQIMNAITEAKSKMEEKELEKQVKILFENDEWLVLRPLSYKSSKKYGASTKWCTAAQSDPAQFIKYAGRGILIYSINKKTGLKVATHKFIKLESGDDKSITFWNSEDKKIDSMECGLPDDILKIIKSEILTYPLPNGEFAKLNKTISNEENEKRLLPPPGTYIRPGIYVKEAEDMSFFENRNSSSNEDETLGYEEEEVEDEELIDEEETKKFLDEFKKFEEVKKMELELSKSYEHESEDNAEDILFINENTSYENIKNLMSDYYLTSENTSNTLKNWAIQVNEIIKKLENR